MNRAATAIFLGIILFGCSDGTQAPEEATTAGEALTSTAETEELARTLGEVEEETFVEVEATTTSIAAAEPVDLDAPVAPTTTDGPTLTSTTVVEEDVAVETTTAERTETSTTTAPSTTATAAATAPPPVDDCESVPENCVDPGEDFSGQDLNSSVFFRAEVSGVNFSNANLADTDFSESRAIGTNFTGATLTDAIIESADLTGANFTNANLTDAFVFNSDLTRVVWGNTTCPDGANSDDNGGTCEGTF